MGVKNLSDKPNAQFSRTQTLSRQRERKGSRKMGPYDVECQVKFGGTDVTNYSFVEGLKEANGQL